MLWRKSVRYIPQMEAVECGAASVAMVMDWHGCAAPLSEVRSACEVTRNGSTAKGMIQGAQSYGFNVDVYSLSTDELQSLNMPAILHWEFAHFLVMEKATKKGIHVVDPAKGRYFVDFPTIKEKFTGVAFELAPTPAMEKRIRSNPGLNFLNYAREFKSAVWGILLVLLGSLAIQLASLVFPVASQILIDKVLIPRQEDWLWFLAVALVVAMLGEQLVGLARSRILAILQKFFDKQLMGRFVTHMLKLPLSFFSQRGTGDLMQRVSLNESIRSMFTGQTVSSILDGVLLIFYVFLMLAYSWKLGSIALLFGLFRVSLTTAVRKKTVQMLMTASMSAGRQGTSIADAVFGMETVKAAKLEEGILECWYAHMVDRVNATIGTRRLNLYTQALSSAVQSLILGAIYWVGGKEVFSGAMTMGAFSAFMSLQSMFLGPLETLVGAYGQFQNLASSIERLDDVIETKPEPDGDHEFESITGSIQLKDVSFRYSPSLPDVVQNVSLSIAPGQRVALVGSSGSGKSTLAHLLTAMLRPTGGVIEYDGVDLTKVKRATLLRHMGVVTQDNVLFNDTVHANVVLGNPEINSEAVRDACEVACMTKEIALMEHGFKSMVGEGGRQLSGGQRQRLCVARAVVTQPKVLLLDEATSALDIETERRLHGNLKDMGCTRIVIAHRLATVMDADLVVVMEDGKVVETGTVQVLMKSGGPFSRFLATAEGNRG